MSRFGRLSLAAAVALVVALALPTLALAGTLDSSPPTSTVKLVFIHHSTGEAWLADGHGGLGVALRSAGYFVSDTNYGWTAGGTVIGDRTDVGDWWTWFRGPSADAYTTALYGESGQNCSYSRLASDPGGANQIVMFKSCFPNSGVGGSPSDAIPPIGSNPLAGNGMSDLTVGNAKGVYLDLLEYMKLHPEKLFVLIVSPPLRSADTNATQAANARALANWLVDPSGWLSGYTQHNVVAFDFFTVLTGGHHRIVDGAIQHGAGPSNYLAFPTGDSHPSDAGDQIATAEFVPFLNAAYNSWRHDQNLPPVIDIASTTITIRSSASTVSYPRPFVLSGGINPGGVGDPMVVWVRKPGTSRWSYSSNRIAYSSSGTSGLWWYRYTPKLRGTYYFRAQFVADATRGASVSNQIAVRVR